MSNPHVRIVEVSKSFGPTRALCRVSLEVPRGSFTTFLGPSGCGKTTLLRIIAGLQEADSGSLFIGNRMLNGTPSHLRGAVMVFQDYALFPHLTAAKNIAYGLRVRKLPGAEIQSRVSRIASYLGVDGLLDRRPAQLSGGQQQRIALARALVTEPEVLLLDEPLSNLDARLRETVRAELRRVQRSLGITTIYVTHDQTEALSMSDQVVVMDRGTVVQTGSPRQVYSAPRNAFVASFVGTANLFPARVTRCSRPIAYCGTNGFTIPVRVQGAEIAVGSDVILSVRPEHVSLSTVAPSPSAGPQAVVKGVVSACLFEGSRARYWIEAMGREVVADAPDADEGRELRGEVFLTFDADRIHLMLEEPRDV